MPRVSVIIVSDNQCVALKPVLESIQATEYPDLEVIVVDNSSQDAALQLAASFPGTSFIQNKEDKGFAEASNQGLVLAKGQYIALINNVTVIAKHWIASLVDFLETHPRIAAAGGKTYFWDASNPVGNSENSYFSYTIMDSETGWNQTMVDTPDVVRRVADLFVGAVMIRRTAIDHVGGTFMEPEFFTDSAATDFFARVVRKGWDLFYLPEAAVWQKQPTTEGYIDIHNYSFCMERNRILCAYRNFEGKELHQIEVSFKCQMIRNAWRYLLRSWGAMRMERRAQWDAWTWCRRHHAELLWERARLFSDELAPYNATVRALQSCAEPLPILSEGDTHDLVSIIIANYNYGRFLKEAIESALGQTYPRVEVVVVDDGSKDDSLEVAKRYPVMLIPQQNQGVGAARNHGAAIANGKYLVFLDADDVLETTYVTRCLEALRQGESHVVYAYTGMRHFGAEDWVYPSRPFDAKKLLAGPFIHVSALVSRSAFEAVGGFDPTWRLGHEDYELWIRMLHHGFHGVLVPEPLLKYRRHGVSRNALSRKQQRELRWRMRFTYPALYWPKLLKDPIRTAYFLIRFWNFSRRKRKAHVRICVP